MDESPKCECSMERPPASLVLRHCVKTRNIKSTVDRDCYDAAHKCDVTEWLPPRTPLSDYIERWVNTDISDVDGRICVRVVSNFSNVLTLDKNVEEFLKEITIEAKFPYKSRTIMCFQATTKGYVAFFAAYFQEFGANCPIPNRNTAYISMIDSAHLYKPASQRRKVFFTVLLSYINYIRNCGFSRVFLWSCPPIPGDEYIFNQRPISQKTPTAEMLQDWYKSLMGAALEMGILTNFGNLYEWCPREPVEFFRQFPYFFEYHWRDEMEQAVRSYEDVQHQEQRNKKCPKKQRKTLPKNKDGKFTTQPIDKCRFVYKKMISAIHSYRNSFFWMSLNETVFNTLSMEKYDREWRFSTLVDSRDELVRFFKENGLEFKDVQSAEHATAMLLKELREHSFYCSICTQPMPRFRMHCDLPIVDVCVSCIKQNTFTYKQSQELVFEKLSSFLPIDHRTWRDSFFEEYFNWKSCKAKWWYKFKNAVWAHNPVALSILFHVQTCKRTFCLGCMRFKNLGNFYLLKHRDAELNQFTKAAPSTDSLLENINEGTIDDNKTNILDLKQKMDTFNNLTKGIEAYSRMAEYKKMLKKTDSPIMTRGNLNLNDTVATFLDIRQRKFM